MSYQYRIHLLRNNTSPAGHAFIELRGAGVTTFYELNTNPNFPAIGTGWLAGWNLMNANDRQINRADNLADSFLQDLVPGTHVASRYVDMNAEQYGRMGQYAEMRRAENNGYTDYHLTQNSCITFVDAVLRAAGVTTPISSLFGYEDARALGDAWILGHHLLLDVPRPHFMYPAPGSTWASEGWQIVANCDYRLRGHHT